MIDTEELGLPGLPRPKVTYADHSYPAYSERQMVDYAQASRATPADHSVPVANENDQIEHNGVPIMQIWFECNRDVFTFYDRITAPQPEAQSVRDAWQPIETAPKDGSMFLGWVNAVRYGESDEGAHFETDVSEIDFCRWQSSETDGYFEGLSGPRGDAEYVTHWRTLPAPPQKPVSDEVKP